MTRNQLKVGLLTACLASISSIAQAQTCGAESHTHRCKCHKAALHCNDEGLLKVINKAATSIEDRLARFMPDKSSRCDDLACGCEKCHSKELQSAGSDGMSPGPNTPIAEPWINENESHPTMLPRPSVRTPELVPAPDTGVDPFQDDTARRARSIPSRPVGYQRPDATYGQSYDPQANSRSVQASNEVVRVVTRKISSHDFALQSSSRKSTSSLSPNSQPTLAQPLATNTVVTAAAIKAVAPQASDHPVEPAYFNPLRSQ